MFRSRQADFEEVVVAAQADEVDSAEAAAVGVEALVVDSVEDVAVDAVLLEEAVVAVVADAVACGAGHEWQWSRIGIPASLLHEGRRMPL